MEKLPRTRLIEERKRRKWSQQEVADQIGTTQNNVSRWELGLTTPGAYLNAKLCTLFGKSAQELELLPATTSPHDTFTQEQIRDTVDGTLPGEPVHEEVASIPSCCWHVPYPRNPFFTGRNDILSRLHAILHQESAAILSQSYALSGLGGVGKTQVALEYAYRYANDYAAVFWISAETEENIISSFVALADLLNLLEKQEREQHRVITAVTRWLNAHSEWLLIFDNVEELELVKHFVPATRHGALLFTSRRHALGISAHTLNLATMSPEEGLRFLLCRARLIALASPLNTLDREEVTAAQEIVRMMGGLPLALDQAGAYIEATRCSLSDYLHLLHTTPLRLLDERETYAEHPQSVTRTFALAFEQLERRSPQAAELLTACSFLAPEAIPEAFFLEGAAQLGPTFEALAADSWQFQATIKALLSYSLIQRQATTHTLAIHRLVQAVRQECLPEADQRSWAERVIHAMTQLFPAKRILVDYWQKCEQLLPHALVCIALGDQWEADVVERTTLMSHVATYFWNRAQVAEAETLLQRALRICESALGSEHPQTADILLGLANIFFHQGKYEIAEPLYQRTLRIWEHALGFEHLRVATPLNNLACLYLEQGRYGEVETLYLRALHIREQALTPEHPLVASSLANLGTLYQELGKYKEARTLFEHALRIAEHALGPEDPQVAFPLGGLATIFLKQGKYTQAEALFQRALHIREQTLGPEHPLLADILSGLATLYREQSKYEEAEALYQRAVCLRQQGLGQEHSEIAEPLYGLATLYREQGRHEEAETLYQRALYLRQKGWKAEHPLLVEPLSGLARLYSELKQYEEAEMLYEKALHICEQKLGPEHPLTAATFYDQACLYAEQGKRVSALPLYHRALAIREHALGLEHPKTIETRTKYLKLLGSMSQDEGFVKGKVISAE